MSSNLIVRPTNIKGLDLGTGLKFALRKQLGEPINSRLTREFNIFLQGVASASNDLETISDANKLIAFLDKYGEADIKEEY